MMLKTRKEVNHMQIIEKNISDLVPYENNPRRNEDAVQYVKASIQEFGFKVPVIIDKDNVIIAEMSAWDWSKLEDELDALSLEYPDGLDMSQFGFNMNEESESLSDIFEDTEKEKAEKKPKTMTCPHCGETFEV